MAFDEGLAAELRHRLGPLGDLAEKRMFGGLCFMHRGHMLCGVNGERMMLRVGKPNHDAALALAGASEMDFTGKPLAGFIYLDPAEAGDEGIAAALALAQAFNATLPAK